MKFRYFALAAAVLAAACGKTPDTVPQEVTLTVPQNVKLHSATETSLTFQWGTVEGATGYNWKLTLDGAQVKGASAKNRNVVVEGLTPGTTYGFSVCAVAGEKTSAWSGEISAKTDGTVPTPPDPSAKTVCVDAPLSLELSSTPVLGTSGYIRVFRKDGTKVDEINLADISTVNVLESGVMVPKEQMTNSSKLTTFMDAISGGSRYRVVNYTPLWVKGKTLEIRLHQGVLDFGTEYYVTVDESVCGKAVAAGEWTLTTASRPSSDASLTVAADGTGDFCTVQGALAFANKNGAEITVKAGTYEECLYLRDKSNITIKGASRDGVQIAYPNNESYANGSGGGMSSKPSVGTTVTTGGRSLFLVENCDNLVLENFTIENTFWVSDHKGQAECIYFNSGSNSHKMTIESCNLLSWQDTFLTKGKVWVHNSLIAGHVDYIWGYPDVCLFEDCEIRSRAGGYIVQARVPSGCKGFVFLNCKLTAESGVKDGSMYLARSNGSKDKNTGELTYSGDESVAYINCTMSPVIASAGWFTNPVPNPNGPTATVGWREYGSKTPAGTAVTGHNSYGKVLTAAEAEPYLTRESILGW